MGIRWRLGLVAILAAAVLGGLVPQGVVAGAETAATQMVQTLERPLTGPRLCRRHVASGSCTVSRGGARRHPRRARGRGRGHAGRPTRSLVALPAGTSDPLFTRLSS